MPSRNIHLVGSVPLANARDVFTTVSAALGPRLLRIPDGETGERSDWIAHLEPVFANHPAFEKSDEVFRLHSTAPPRTRYRLKSGASTKDVMFDNLLYAETAIRSYREFSELKQRGTIPAHCRFQVDLVPAHSVIWLFVQEHLHRALDPIYNDAVQREIDRLAAVIPHDQLAIQFDVASAVFARLQRNESNAYGQNKEEMLKTFGTILVELADHVSPLLYADETAYVRLLASHEQSLEDALTLFEVGRRQFARVLRALPDEAFDRRGTHNRRGTLTVGDQVQNYIKHVDDHLAFLVKKRERLGKPVSRSGGQL